MSEEVVRQLLNDAASGDPPPITADAATLLARARSANRRRAAGAATAIVLLILAGTGAVIGMARSSDQDRQGSVESSASLSPSARAGVPRPSTTAEGPFCGWKDTLAPAVMAALPIKGAWGRPSLVSGICGDSAGVQITVDEAGRTGQVSAVITRIPPDNARKEACIAPKGPCEQLPDGYLYWAQVERRDDGRVSPNNARLATASGLFIDVTCRSDAYDDNGQRLALPPMDHAPCTGLQARALALELVKTDWLD
jgi:hypothetical protein